MHLTFGEIPTLRVIFQQAKRPQWFALMFGKVAGVEVVQALLADFGFFDHIFLKICRLNIAFDLKWKALITPQEEEL
jgi:hypothetical protein